MTGKDQINYKNSRKLFGNSFDIEGYQRYNGIGGAYILCSLIVNLDLILRG